MKIIKKLFLKIKSFIKNIINGEYKNAHGNLAAVVEDKMKRESKPEELIALDEALKKLEQLNQRQSKIIEHWFFVGLNHEEIAEILCVSVPTVRRDFRLAKAWLSRELKQKV